MNKLMSYFYKIKLLNKPNKQLTLYIDNLEIAVSYKAVKYLRIIVSPPDGKVKVSSPKGLSQQMIRRFVSSKLDWIKKHQLRYSTQIKPLAYNYLSGEKHYLFGLKYTLNLVESKSRQQVKLLDDKLFIYLKPNSTQLKRENLLNEFYRSEIKILIPKLIQKWQPIIEQQVAGWNIRKMKTRWGSCNISRRNILLNLDLAKKPLACIEYVLVHEMVHLLERYHNKRFYLFMDKFLPNWKALREQLNQSDEK